MAPRSDQTRFRVEVTEEDVAKAVRNDSAKCVVAQAIARTIPDATRIEVDTQAIRFTRAEVGKRFAYLSPPEVSGYVIAFDAGDELGPFRFWMSNPLITARKVRTKAGRTADNAREKAKRQTNKPALATTAKVASESEPLTDEAKAEAGKAAYLAAKEEAVGEPLTKSDGGVRPRPRVYKTGKRVYGSRILRVNRYLQDAEPTA